MFSVLRSIEMSKSVLASLALILRRTSRIIVCMINRPWSPKSPTRDYTKSFSYAIVDLVAKIASAISLVALGVAGWLLQADAQHRRELIEDHDRQEQAYLPMLLTLTELEAALDPIPAIFESTKAPDDTQVMMQAQRLHYLANVIFIPRGESDRVTVSRFSPSVSPARGEESTDVCQVPIRSAALMLANATARSGVLMSEPSGAYVEGSYDRKREPRLEITETPYADLSSDDFVPPPPKIFRIYYLLGNDPAIWRVWYGRSHGRVYQVRYYLGVLAKDLQVSIAARIHHVLEEHPQLGERYVSIRQDIYHQYANPQPAPSQTPANQNPKPKTAG